jgi:Calcineurin-like phosphoesterase
MRVKSKSSASLVSRSSWLIIVLFAAFGVWALGLSRGAGTTAIKLEPTRGSDPNISSISNSGASGGSAIRFKRPVTEQNDFAIVVVPDTQYTIKNWPNDYLTNMRWIKDNAASKNVKFVLHVGDIQEYPSNTTTCGENHRLDGHRTGCMHRFFPKAKEGISLLDGVVPYSIAIGNHDLDSWSVCTHCITDTRNYTEEFRRASSVFNEYFPIETFQSMPTFGGSYPAGSSDNVWQEFSTGGTDWLVLTLKFNPTPQELAWANTVVSQKPNHRVLVTTHNYLNGDGSRNATGNSIWNEFAKLHKNVQFIFAGHINPGARRVDLGNNGNSVYQLLSDYQADLRASDPADPLHPDNADKRLANSWIRLMTFKPADREVVVKTYSPVFDKYKTGNADDFILSDVPFGPID